MDVRIARILNSYMSTQFRNAIVRVPGSNFADGLTTSVLGRPRHELAVQQHVTYCEALRQCGLNLTMLPADLVHPDSTFVEDAAVLTAKGAIVARPGAPTRLGEAIAIRVELEKFFPALHAIEAPGTLDAGDICDADGHFFLGLSLRSNEEGLRQLAAFLASLGYTSTVIDVRNTPGILHLKSGIASLGENTLVLWDSLAGLDAFEGYERIVVAPEEQYAANCVRINERVLVPAGFPKLTAELERRGFRPLPVEVSEFEKMDGGLSCLSLRF
jgi:dimethylargininase